MACMKCKEINQIVEIRSPAALAKAIRIVKANLGDGTLTLEPAGPAVLASMPPFADLPPEGPWPDCFEFHFRCAHCGQKFRLDAETYHGAGGQWRTMP